MTTNPKHPCSAVLRYLTDDGETGPGGEADSQWAFAICVARMLQQIVPDAEWDRRLHPSTFDAMLALIDPALPPRSRQEAKAFASMVQSFEPLSVRWRSRPV